MDAIRSRKEKVELLSSETWDCVFIGGGSVGSGAALDASLRGLKTLLIERDDFSSGTSSKSTKLIHGGVRYLPQFQFSLIKESLSERKILMKNAPHLVKPIKFLLPCYELFEIPYYNLGLSFYDLLAGESGLPLHKKMGVQETLRELPYLKKKKLKGSIAYYDATFNDSRLNLALARAAEMEGALVLNKLEMLSFQKQDGKIHSASVLDRISGKSYTINSKLFVNTTGPGLDRIRSLDDDSIKPILRMSKGVHLVFPLSKTSIKHGMILPKTQDGRVVFLIPWENHLILGTTDTPVDDPLSEPRVEKEDIEYLLETISPYLEIPFQKSEILSSFAGFRPLISINKTGETKSLSREEATIESPSGLISMGGGKWTTYRKISERLVNRVSIRLNATTSSRTEKYLLPGTKGYVDNLYVDISQKYGIDTEVAKRLRDAYGEEVFSILGEKPVELKGIEGYFKEEVRFFISKEFAESVVDILGRRFRILFCNLELSKKFIEPILEILAEMKKWDSNQIKKERIESLKTIDVLMGKI